MTELEILKYAAERIRYDPETGYFFWKQAGGYGPGRHEIGDKLVSEKRGYIRVRLKPNPVEKETQLVLHRLAWFLTYNEIPETIDHINKNSIDNRIVNLRNVNQLINGKNRTKSKNNTSGYTGVTKKGNKWEAGFKLNGIRQYVGMFNTPEEANTQLIIERAKHGFTEDHGT